MIISEVKNLKNQLESKILSLIKNFEECTLIKVKEVIYDYENEILKTGELLKMNDNIKVEI